MKIRTLICIVFILGYGMSWGKDYSETPKPFRPIEFIENRGQWPGDFLFRAGIGNNGVVYLQHDGILFDFEDPEMQSAKHDLLISDNLDGELRVHHHSWKLFFVNAENARVESQLNDSHYYNYFLGNDSTKWQSKIYPSEKVVYHDLWPGIDFIAYSANGNFKYDFVVSTEADIGSIQLRLEGIDDFELVNGKLIMQTSVGEFVDNEPVAYSNEVQLDCHYVVNADRISFNVPLWDKKSTLVIDPELIGATYLGSTQGGFDFVGLHSALFSNGNNISCGLAYSQMIPATFGAYDTTFNGGVWDLTISCFNQDCTDLLYCTYFGGSLADVQFSIEMAGNNSFYISGMAISPDFPTTLTAAGYFLSGVTDVFISHFSSDGSELLSSSFIGGTLFEPYRTLIDWGILDYYGANDCGLDFENNSIYGIAGSTNNWQSNYEPGFFSYHDFSTSITSLDFNVYKLDADLTDIFWVTRIGGSGDENTRDMQVLKNGNIAIFGSTASNDILITPGSYQTNYGGGFDGYLAILSPDGSQVLYSTYLGGDGQDEIQYLSEDNQGRLWICGISTSELPLIGDGYNDPGSWQFIACFDPELNNLIHYHLVGAGQGSTNMFWPSAFMVDDCNRIYLTGDGGAQTVSNVNITPDALYSEGSFYTAVYGADMSELIYGSYLGGNHRHGPDNQYNRKGIICQSVCSNINTPVYPPANAYSDTQVATWEGSTWIIDMDSPATVSAFDYEPSGSSCIPYSVHFTNWSDSASYQWNFGDGSGWVSDQSLDVLHTFTESGTYYVQLIATNTQSCNYADTIGWWIVTPTVQSPMQLAVESNTGSLCELPILATLEYTGNGADSFEWHDSEGNVLGTDSILEINISNMNGVEIILYGIESSCNYADSIITTIIPSSSPDATFIADDSLLVAQEDGSYQWYINGNAIAGANGPTYLAAESGNYSLSVTNEFGCTSFSELQFIEVMVKELSTEMISVYPNPADESITINSGNILVQSILIFDNKGRLVKEVTGINGRSTVVDCNSFASGTYYVSLVDRNGEVSTLEFVRK